MTEQELVARAKAGDQSAFEQLVLDNQKRIYTLCLRMTGDPGDGEDLAQEAFLHAWRGLPSFQGDSSFSTWVYRLASNVCLDFLRKRKRRQNVEGGPSVDDQDSGWTEPSDPVQDPEGALLRQEVQRAVEQGLAVQPGQCLLRPHWRQGRANVRVGGSDFCENQTEINTPIFKSAEEVVADLDRQ